ASESAGTIAHATTMVQQAPSTSTLGESSTAPSAQSAIQIAPAVTPSTAISVPAPSLPATRLWLSYLAPLFLLGWTAGTLFFLGPWNLNTMRFAGWVRRASVLTDSGWNAQVRALSGELGIERHVALLVSDEIEVPITAGVLFPKIVLSPEYAEWSSTRRLAILNHELAHVRRLDALTQLLVQVTIALYWFHPLVWLTARAMRAERERACDDQVLASGTKASDY